VVGQRETLGLDLEGDARRIRRTADVRTGAGGPARAGTALAAARAAPAGARVAAAAATAPHAERRGHPTECQNKKYFRQAHCYPPTLHRKTERACMLSASTPDCNRSLTSLHRMRLEVVEGADGGDPVGDLVHRELRDLLRAHGLDAGRRGGRRIDHGPS